MESGLGTNAVVPSVHVAASSDLSKGNDRSSETAVAERRGENHPCDEEKGNEKNGGNSDDEDYYDSNGSFEDPNQPVETSESREAARRYFELGKQIADMRIDIYDMHTKVNKSSGEIATLQKEVEIDKKEKAECSAELRQQQENMHRLLEALKKSSSEDGQMKFDLATMSDQLKLCKSEIDALKDRNERCEKTEEQKRVRFAELDKQHKDGPSKIDKASGCAYIAHNFWLSHHADVNLTRDSVIRPYISPSMVASAHRASVKMGDAQARKLVLLDDDNPEEIISYVDRCCVALGCKALVVQGYARSELPELYTKSAVVVDWCMRGSVRMPLEAALHGFILGPSPTHNLISERTSHSNHATILKMLSTSFRAAPPKCEHLLSLARMDVWDELVQPLLSDQDKALLRVVCKSLRARYRRFTSLRILGTLGLSVSFYEHVMKMLPHEEISLKRVACESAAASGSLECLTHAHRNGCEWTEKVCTAAAAGGHLECLAYARDRGCAWSEECSTAAAKNGRLRCLKYAFDNGCEIDELACAHAVRGGNTECLLLAHDRGCQWDARTCYVALQVGDLNCLRCLIENGCAWCEHACTIAAHYGHLECMKYAHERGCELVFHACHTAATNGRTECLRYALDNCCERDALVCSYAAASGHLESLRCAHERGCGMDSTLCAVAARAGRIDCLRYAHEKGCALDLMACMYAAEHGHLDCLRYAFVHGCEPSARICAAAASGGQLHCLKYAHEKGCALEPEVCESAAAYGALPCLEYAREHGCGWTNDVCSMAAQYGHLDCLRYAHEHGCGWDSNVCVGAASCGALSCLVYAHEHGCEWTDDVCLIAAQYDHLDCLRYARENGCAWTSDTCVIAIEHESLSCAQYAYRNGCEITPRTIEAAIFHDLDLVAFQGLLDKLDETSLRVLCGTEFYLEVVAGTFEYEDVLNAHLLNKGVQKELIQRTEELLGW
ncbi:hypothetical protein CYMTET_38630 [Cymbomonas tetramitiformis]|uniref:Uncharacterized protein n=1 Tax=Cymbomonas tetramitiformis TaxID=36881 RepID=A0AAE0CDX5_9CHLO|nr:hypothetical protein CYMTET_38630 [Cymbomonas tetramitiformis]